MVPRPIRLAALLGLLATAVVTACSPTSAPTTSGPTSSLADATPETSAASIPAPSGQPAATDEATPTAATGFEFGADAVLGFYEDTGFTCGGPEPSTGADGWTVQTCEEREATGRRLSVGVVRNAEGELGDGFASVTAAKGEDFVNPVDALDHLSGFLGAMLGDTRATEQLEWLAGAIGSPYEEVTVGDLRVATYLRPSDDPRTIWLEVAGPEYLAAPRP